MGWSLQDLLSPQTTVGKEVACGSWWGLMRWWRGNTQWPGNLIGFNGWFSTTLHAYSDIWTLLLSPILSLSLCACISPLSVLHTFIQCHVLSWHILPVISLVIFFSNDKIKIIIAVKHAEMWHCQEENHPATNEKCCVYVPGFLKDPPETHWHTLSL